MSGGWTIYHLYQVKQKQAETDSSAAEVFKCEWFGKMIMIVKNVRI
jgi:hypothetical protein